MNLLELIDKAGIPIVIILVYIIVYGFRARISNWLKQNKHRTFFEEVIQNFKITYKSPWQIGLPAIVTVIATVLVLMLLTYFYKAPVHLSHYGEPLWFRLLGRTLLNSVSEEILFRGTILGGILLTGVPYIFKGRFKGGLYITAVLILQAGYFAYAHQEYNIISLVTRFLNGLITGVFYVAYKRNLLPAISAHITHNLLISLNYFNPQGT